MTLSRRPARAFFLRAASQLFFFLILLSLWPIPGPSFAQEITGREVEIVERLTRLEEGQKALAQRLEDVNSTLNQRLDDLRAEMNQRFEHINQRFEHVNQRFDDINQRFDDINSRFNDVMTMLQIIVSALIALVLAIAGAGLVMWRKILTVDAAVQTKIGLDQAVRDQVIHLEQEIGFVKGKLKELSDLLSKN